MTTQHATIDENKLHEFMGKMVEDLGAAATSVLVILGQELGLYRALAGHGPLTASELAQKTGAATRYVQEWAANQAASGYIEYDVDTECFYQTPEQAAVFSDDDSPFFMGGGFYSIASLFSDQPKLVDMFRTGKGVSWGDHDSCLFCGTAKFFKPTYKANLLSSWIPALDGVQAKLERGAKVADVGCGYGHSTLMMAEAFPQSQFFGFDFHAPSIEHARHLAKEKGLGNVTFDVARAKDFPGENYDLITFFDCLHDMGDPQGACQYVRGRLDRDGTLMIVEPIAQDTLKENLNPVGRVYYAFSTTVCTPSSLSQEVGLALGAQAGEKRLREVVTGGGFSRCRRATETPFNMILEARP
ncbi:methyltransferase domain-containing protein [Nitrospina sp. 32_T5]|uniref:class I SAM-dependent methyltransferase n=1 Tax=unclassified Nitrospina TaxID=2638683 RepID=UPI003F95FBAA